MSNLIYHIVTPENDNPNGFQEFDMIDFVLNYPDRKMLSSTVRITGDVLVDSTKADNNTFATNNIYLDNLTGAHSFLIVFKRALIVLVKLRIF